MSTVKKGSILKQPTQDFSKKGLSKRNKIKLQSSKELDQANDLLAVKSKSPDLIDKFIEKAINSHDSHEAFDANDSEFVEKSARSSLTKFSMQTNNVQSTSPLMRNFKEDMFDERGSGERSPNTPITSMVIKKLKK